MDVDLDDLFDTEPARDGPTGEHAEPLFSDDSDKDEDGADANADGENQDDAQKKTDEANAEAVKPKKKRVSRPQPKLNGDRLCGARGIGVMEEAFSDLVFAGRGHERRDLNLLMARMEHWAHRLFPKMPFDQTIQRIEKLGKSKQVQVNVKKLRMGMDVLPAEVAPEEDTTERGQPERDVFDELIGGSPPTSPLPPHERPATPPPPAQTSSLTEEQKENMRKNREAAQLRRMRAQFTRQQQEQQMAPESEAETGIHTEVGSNPDAPLATETHTAQSPTGARSPVRDHSSSDRARSPPAETGGGGDSVAALSDAEMEDRLSCNALGDDAVDTTGFRRPGTPDDGAGDRPRAPRAPETSEAESVAPRLGHLHQMSETAPIVVDDDDESDAIVIPDDVEATDREAEAEAIVVPDDAEATARDAEGSSRDTEGEAIVVPDDVPETDAIVIPDDDEDEPMAVTEDVGTEAVEFHESTEAAVQSDGAAGEVGTTRTGHLHQMSESEAVVDTVMEEDVDR